MANATSLDLSTETSGDATVVIPVGRIDGSTASPFQEALLKLIDEGAGSLVVDFEKIEYISSAGLRVLLLAAKQLQAGGRKIVLCSMRDHISEVFKISGFNEILAIHPTRQEAVNAS